MNKVLAVIGAGSIGQRHYRNLQQLFPDHDIVWLSARQCGTAPVSPALTQLLQRRPAFVVLASPAPAHMAQAGFFLQQQIPVLIEKPLSHNLAEAETLYQLAIHHQVPVAVAYCLRYRRPAVLLHQLLKSGELGQVYTVQCHVGQYLPDWRPDKAYQQSVSASAALGGGVLNELSHELDYLHWLFGPLQLGHAAIGNTGTLQLDVEDHAVLLLYSQQPGYHNLMPITVQLDFLQPAPRRACVLLTCAGRVEWDLITDTLMLTTKQGSQILYQDPDYQPNTMYLSMLTDFAEQAQRGQFDSSSMLDALATVRLIADCKRCPPPETLDNR